jgi:hypothetical protein
LFSEVISQSTWGYPVIAACHVLAMALFGGCVLVANLRIVDNVSEVRGLKWTGFTLVMLTGVLLFLSSPLRYSNSRFFQLKLLLLLLLGVNAVCLRIWPRPGARYISLGLWIAVIFAARGIAFF